MTHHERFQQRLAQHLERLLAPHGTTYDYMRGYVLDGGKQVRPRMFLEALEAWHGEIDDAALDIACALELLHTFFLIHDDIMDEDDMRRDKPTLHAYFMEQGFHDAIGKALIWGDILYTEVIRLVAPLSCGTELLQLFGDVTLETAHGQLLEADRAHFPPLETLLSFYEKKTALYSIYLPLKAASLLTQQSIAEKSLRAFSGHLGLAYQVYDDLTEVKGTKQRRKEDRCGDIMRLKATPLLLRVQQDLPFALKNNLLEQYRQGATLPLKEELEVLAYMNQGTIKEIQEMIIHHAETAAALQTKLQLENCATLKMLVRTYQEVSQ